MNPKITPQKTELQRIGEAALDAEIAEDAPPVTIHIRKQIGVCLLLANEKLIHDSISSGGDIPDLEIKVIACAGDYFKFQSGRKCSRDDCPAGKGQFDGC